MRALTPLAIAACVALAAPAYAQSQGSSNPATSGSSGSASMRMSQDEIRQSQDNMRKSLEQAGFEQIQILDAAYLVHAHTSDGLPVTMWIDPQSGDRTSGPSAASGSRSSN